MKRKYVVENHTIFDIERPDFFEDFPMLAPAVSELDAALAGIKERPTINCFLVAFCRLFEMEVASDDDKLVDDNAVGTIIASMCRNEHLVPVDGKVRSLNALYRAALREAASLAPNFKQTVATMYARRYRLN
jgi:hypothetical protein